MQKCLNTALLFVKRAIGIFSASMIFGTLCSYASAQNSTAPRPVARPSQPQLITQPNHPLHPLSLTSATFDPDACNRIPDATHGLTGTIPSDADLQIVPGTQAHAPRNVDEVRCALRLAVFLSYRADQFLAANLTPTDSQKQTTVQDYQRSDEILATLAAYFESHSDQPSPIDAAIVAGVKALADTNAASHISAISLVLLADPLAPKDAMVTALMPNSYMAIIQLLDGYDRGVDTDPDYNSNVYLHYTFPQREAEAMRNFVATFYTLATDPQTPDAFFADIMKGLGPPPPGWNAQTRSLMMLGNMQIALSDSIQDIVVSRWMANHKLGIVSNDLFTGDALWNRPATYGVQRSMTIGQHNGSNCGSKSDPDASFASKHEPVTTYQCQINNGDFSQASYPIVYADTVINPWGSEAPSHLYNVVIQSMVRGGHDNGHGLIKSPNDLSASLSYNLTANADIPQCNDLTKCSAFVDLYYFEFRGTETGSTTDGVLASLSSSASYTGAGMAAAVPLPKNQHVLVERSAGPVHVTFSMGRNDHHDQGCCFHTLRQSAGVNAVAADPIYPPLLPPTPAAAAQPAPGGGPAAAPAPPAGPILTLLKRPPSGLALENYLLFPGTRIEPVSGVRFTIGQLPADRRLIVNPQFTTRFEDTYLHFMELSLLDALPPGTLDGYDQKSIGFARGSLFQEARRLYLDNLRNEIKSDNQYLQLVDIPEIVHQIDKAYIHILTTGDQESQTPLDFLDAIHSFANDLNATSVQTSLTTAQQAAHSGDRQSMLNSLAKLRDNLWHLNNMLQKRHNAMLLELANLDPPATAALGDN